MLARHLLILLAFVASPGFAADMVRDYPASQISPRTYVIHGPLGYPSVKNQGFMNNPAFVVTDHGVVVIDPGSSVQAGRMVLKQIRRVTAKPVTHVFDTHIHGDHWLGNQAMTEAFPNALLIGHPEMIRRLGQGAAAEWLGLMERATGGFTAGTRAAIPTQPADGGTVLKIDGLTFNIHAPGKAHSGTDIMIEFVEDSVLFAGDNLLNQRLGRLDDGTFLGSIAALDYAAGLAVKHYVPGHGPTGGSEIVRGYRNYLAILYAETRRLYEKGLADYEMKGEIVAKLAAYRNWANFDDEVGRHISQAVLEIEDNLDK
jgi:glyoxylase-like metal-dependent hydrolase (beta-lactamase superfamily II)